MRGEHALHHMRKRRISNSNNGHNHKELWVRNLDRIVLFVAILSPLFTFPQLALIYFTKNAAGVSALSWGAYSLFNVPWLVYGIVHKDKPIIVSTSLWFVINLAVMVGAILY